jgi:hypothetical protein
MMTEEDDSSRLETCAFGVRGVPLEPLSGAVGMGVLMAAIFGFGFTSFRTAVFVGLSIAVASFLIVATQPMWAAARTRMWVDEAGIRWEYRNVRSYWPFELLGRCSIDRQIWGGEALVIFDRTDRKALSVPLFGDGPKEQALALASVVNTRIAQALPTPEPLQPLLRRGRLTTPWLRALDEIASKISGGGDYRSVSIDAGMLRKAFRNKDLSPDCRAAAGYVLIILKDREAEEQVRAGLNEASAPTVLFLAHAAGVDLDPNMMASATRFLDSFDTAD